MERNDEERQDDLEFFQHGNFADCDDSDDEERRDSDYNEFIKKFIRWF